LSNILKGNGVDLRIVLVRDKVNVDFAVGINIERAVDSLESATGGGYDVEFLQFGLAVYVDGENAYPSILVKDLSEMKSNPIVAGNYGKAVAEVHSISLA